MQKIPCLLLLSLLLLPACQNPFNDECGSCRLLHDDLYADNEGNLYLKAEDRFPPENGEKPRPRWIWALYCEDCRMIIEGDTTEGMSELKDKVDSSSFRKLGADPTTGNVFYTDKNHYYLHKLMYDGGTLSIIRDK